MYRGSYDPDENYGLPAGVYELVTIGDDGTPLAHALVKIDDLGVPLMVLPKTGENPVPVTILWTAMISSLAGVVMILRRKKEEES